MLGGTKWRTKDTTIKLRNPQPKVTKSAGDQGKGGGHLLSLKKVLDIFFTDPFKN